MAEVREHCDGTCLFRGIFRVVVRVDVLLLGARPGIVCDNDSEL